MSINEFQTSALRLARTGLFLLFIIPFVGFGGLYIYTNSSGQQIKLQRDVKILELGIKKAKAENIILETRINGQMEIMRLKAKLAEKQEKLQAIAKFRRSTPGQFILGIQYMFSELWILFATAGFGLVLWKLAPLFQRQVTVETTGFKGLVNAKDSTKLAFRALEVEEIRIAETICQDEREAGKKFVNDSLDVVGKAQKILPKQEIIKKEPMQIESHIEEAQQLPAYIPTKFSFTDMLSELEPGKLALGRSVDTDALAQSEPKKLTCIDIVGKQDHCKTTLFEMIGLGWLNLKRQGVPVDIYYFDPHAGLPDSATEFFKPALHLFKRTVLGEKAFQNGEHINVMNEVDEEIDLRQEQGYNRPWIVFLIDEIHDIFDIQEYAKPFYAKLKKHRRLRKAGIFQIVVYHDSTNEGSNNLGTGLMNLSVSAFVVNATRSKAQKILEKEDAGLAVDLDRGFAVLKYESPDKDTRKKGSELIRIPWITSQDLTPFISETSEIKPVTNVVQDVTLTSELCKQRRTEMDNMSMQALADAAQLKHKMKISRYEDGNESALSNEEKQRVLAVFYPNIFVKNPKVIDLLQHRKVACT